MIEIASGKMTGSSIQIRPIRPGEEAAVSALVVECFHEFVGHEFPPEGIEEFLEYARPDRLARRSEAGALIFVATLKDQPVGMIELRGGEHVALLFVQRQQQGRGIARRLFEKALAAARVANPKLTTVTVHSSRFAVPVYERLGFHASGPERTENGITYVPMVHECPVSKT